MDKLNDLLQELGVSKVRLSKYLGVSRQMVYNYLVLDSLDKWPKEKKLLLFKLLDVNDGKAIEDIEVTTDYLMSVEGRLNQGVKSSSEMETGFNFKGLNKESQVLLSDITYLLKEKLSDEIFVWYHETGIIEKVADKIDEATLFAGKVFRCE